MVDKIKGGLADNMTLDSIAEKHGVTLSVITTQLEKGIKVEMEHTSDKTTATEIAKDHLFEDAEYYSKLKTIEKQNEVEHWITVHPHGKDSKGQPLLVKDGETSKEAVERKFSTKGKDKKEEEEEPSFEEVVGESWAKVRTMPKEKMIRKYLISKEDFEGEDDVKFYTQFHPDELTERIYNKHLKKYKKEKTNSKDWAKTYKASNFIEKGVCTYNDETIYLSQECLNKAIASIKGRPVVIKHQKVDPSNMQDHAVGYVSDCGFCDQEASFYCNFLVFDDEGKEVIAKDYSVSCAYLPKAFGKGGTWHNTPYDREVTELEFTHLALVPDPRYEDAKIYENSKDITTDNTTKETYNMENDKVEVPTALLDKLFGFIQQPFLNAKEEKEPKEEEKIEKDDDELEYEGKKYSKKELVNAFEAACAGKKAKEEKEMKNALEAEAAAKLAEEEKENSKDADDDIEFFNSMQKLMAEASSDASDKVEIPSQNKGLELGSKAFG